MRTRCHYYFIVFHYYYLPLPLPFSLFHIDIATPFFHMPFMPRCAAIAAPLRRRALLILFSAAIAAARAAIAIISPFDAAAATRQLAPAFTCRIDFHCFCHFLILLLFVFFDYAILPFISFRFDARFRTDIAAFSPHIRRHYFSFSHISLAPFRYAFIIFTIFAAITLRHYFDAAAMPFSRFHISFFALAILPPLRFSLSFRLIFRHFHFPADYS